LGVFGRIVRLVGAGLERLAGLSGSHILLQVVLAGGGFGAVQSMVEGWLAGSQGAALAIASILIVGVVAMGSAIIYLVVSIAQAFSQEGVR